MKFTSKLSEADIRDVRKMNRAKTYWLKALLWVAAMIYVTVEGWAVTANVLARAPSEWRMAAGMWGVAVALILWVLYNQSRVRSRKLASMNATRPDQIDLTTDGVKCEGPNGATALVPWGSFKGWKEGRRVMLVERTEGNPFVILPVAQLSEMQRLTIRQFLQSHIPPVYLTNSHPNVRVGEKICSKCGQAYDHYPCGVCVAREANIEKTFSQCFWVATAGVCGAMVAPVFYPPLKESWLGVYTLLALIFIPAPIGIVFVFWQRVTRYAGLFRFIIYLIAAAFVVPAPYYYLNGALDRNSSVVAQAVVSHKSDTDDFLEWTLSWKGKRMDGTCKVSHETFSAVQSGDTVYVLVHPGAFSIPWFRGRDVRTWDSRASDSR